MSERYPGNEPEEEPLAAECGNESCQEGFNVAPENSRIDSWQLMPDCDYVFTHCPHCEEYFMKLFLKDVDKQAYIDIGFEVHVIGDYPPQHIIDSFTTVYGYKPFDPRNVEQIPLTPRQEKLAMFAAYLFMNERLTAEDFNGEGELYL